MSWTAIRNTLNITKEELKDVRNSQEYTLYVANELVWAKTNLSNVPYNLKSTFGVDDNTASS